MGTKPRLIAFGCSYTYGQYLAEDNPSELAWPKLLATLLDREVVNKAHPGSSNLEILHTVLSFPFEEEDLVVIGWTHINRDCIFDKDKNISVGTWSDRRTLEAWFYTHSEYDLSVRSGLYMHHAELFLDSLNLKQYHFQALGAVDIVDRIVNAFTQPKPIYTNKLKHQIKKTILFKKDLALDNAHPGIKSHRHAAQQLYKIINAK